MATLRVATWNVLYRDLESRTPLLADRILEVGPDVLFLQETNPDHARRLADLVGMRLAAVAPATPDHDAAPAILTRIPVVAAGIRQLQPPAPDGHAYVFADIGVGSTTIRCATTHLRHTYNAGRLGLDAAYASAARGAGPLADITDEGIRTSVTTRLNELAQIETIRGGLEPRMEIFGGDLNFVPGGVEYARILEWGMVDSWRQGPRLGSGATVLGTNPLVSGGSEAYASSYSDLLPGHRGPIDYTLDFLFHTPEVIAGHAWTFGTGDGDDWPSDHLGLAVEYTVPGEG